MAEAVEFSGAICVKKLFICVDVCRIEECEVWQNWLFSAFDWELYLFVNGSKL